MSDFRGVWVALVTPFCGGEVDFVALHGLVKKLLADGVAGLVVCGSTGEAAALSEHEQLAVLDAVLQWAPPEQVIMGLCGNNLRELLAFQKTLQQRPLAVQPKRRPSAYQGAESGPLPSPLVLIAVTLCK